VSRPILDHDTEADLSYLIIESSGISEPIQVAETFTQEFAETMAAPVEEIEAGLPEDKDQTPESRKRLAELIAAGGLSKVARLDCCVSMVDCTTFMDDFDTTDFLTDRHGKEVAPEDERNITDLCVKRLTCDRP
jgi:G3E family GTPase